MEDNVTKIKATQETDTEEFTRVQYIQAVETFRSQYSWLTQVTTALVIANATVVGFAITTQSSGILLIGPLFPLMIIYIGHRTFQLMLPTLFVALNIENRHSVASIDWLMSAFTSIIVSPEYVEELRRIGLNPDPAQRIHQLRNAAAPVIWRKPMYISLVLVALGQLLAVILLTAFFNWRLF